MGQLTFRVMPSAYPLRGWPRWGTRSAFGPRRVGLAGSLALVAAGFGGFGVSSGTARTLGVSATVKPVSATEKWIRVSAAGGDALDLFAVQGVDFSIVRVASIRASGVPAPACNVTGTPTTLDLRRSHPQRRLGLRLRPRPAAPAGAICFGQASGGQTDRPHQRPHPSLQRRSRCSRSPREWRAGMGTKTVIFSGQTTFKEVEILPTSAFRIGRVTSVTAGGTKRPVSLVQARG